MRCPTTHELNKRSRTIHLRIATFLTQRGPWRSTHHGFHSPRASNVEGRQETIESALPIVRMHAFHPPCAFLRLLAIEESGPAMLQQRCSTTRLPAITSSFSEGIFALCSWLG